MPPLDMRAQVVLVFGRVVALVTLELFNLTKLIQRDGSVLLHMRQVVLLQLVRVGELSIALIARIFFARVHRSDVPRELVFAGQNLAAIGTFDRGPGAGLLRRPRSSKLPARRQTRMKTAHVRDQFAFPAQHLPTYWAFHFNIFSRFRFDRFGFR